MNSNKVEAGILFKHRGGGKWEFLLPTITAYRFYSRSPQGEQGARKIARILAGSLKRTRGQTVDGMARKMIASLLNPPVEKFPIVY